MVVVRRIAWFACALVGGCQAILGIEDTHEAASTDSGTNGGSGGTLDSGTGAGVNGGSGGSGATGATGGGATGGTGATGGLAGAGGDAGCTTPFTLSPISTVTIVPGASAEVTVSVSKAACFDAPIDVSLSGLPTGATSAPGTIPAGASSTQLAIDAESTTAFGQSSVTVSAASGATQPTTNFTLVVKGASGSYDASFDQDGVRVLGPVANGEISHIAVLPSGEIILALKNGWKFAKLDSMGASVAFTPAVTQSAEVGGLAANAADIVAAVGANAVQLHADGSADQSFSQDGLATPPNGTLTNSSAQAVTIDAGSVLTAGVRNFTLGFVARYLANGTFADSASATYPTVAVVALPSGRVLSGASTGGGNSDFHVSAWDSNLAADTGFGNGGTQTVSVKQLDKLVAMAVLPSSSNVALIGSADPGSGNFAGAVAMITQDGMLDTSYHPPDGFVTTQVIGPGMSFQGGAVQADDKVVAIGNGGSAASGYKAAIIRFGTSGNVDTSFNGGTGSLVLGTVANKTVFTALAIAPDGRLLIGGYDNGGVFLMRLWY